MNKKIIGIATIALVVGIGVGYGGANAFRSGVPGQNMQGNFSAIKGGDMSGVRAGGAWNGGMLSGTVATKDSGSITINTKDGSSHIVLITPATSFLKSVSGAQSDVSVDSTVIVSGMTNSDGSVTAQSVQIRPADSVYVGSPTQTKR